MNLGHQTRQHSNHIYLQVNTIGCADQGLGIFSLEDSKKRLCTVNWEGQSEWKTEKQELMIDSG